MNRISTSGSYDGECYTINVAFNDFHVMTLDGISREDLFELASCITCMMPIESERSPFLLYIPEPLTKTTVAINMSAEGTANAKG